MGGVGGPLRRRVDVGSSLESGVERVNSYISRNTCTVGLLSLRALEREL